MNIEPPHDAKDYFFDVDMADHTIFGQRPHVGKHRPAGECLKRGRADKPD